jgi:hypothetical protein
MWLSATLPVRWGPREQAMKFTTKGEARRAAAAVNVKGVRSVEDA